MNNNYYHCQKFNKMKKIILSILFVIFSLPVVTAQNNQEKKDPVGKWKFEAPAAPEGYTSGTIEVGLADKKYSTAMYFTPIDTKYSGDVVKIENDTLIFNVFIDDEDVVVTLKIEDSVKMSGKAVYSGGEVPLALIKVVAPEAEVKK
jgi:hypothetical protein